MRGQFVGLSSFFKEGKMKTILLFEVNIFKSNQIALLCNKLNINLKIIQSKDYNKPLAVLAGIKKSKKQCDCPESSLGGEMMVLAGFSSDNLNSFIEEYNKSLIPAIKRKAVLTASNSTWNARQLYQHLEEHI